VRFHGLAPVCRPPVVLGAINRSVDREAHPFDFSQPFLPLIPFWLRHAIIPLEADNDFEERLR